MRVVSVILVLFMGAMAGACSPAASSSDAGDGDSGGQHGECRPGQEVCGGRCVNPQSDPSHCGGCNDPCDPGQFCSGGQCTRSCGSGLQVCGDLCVNFADDPNHCGECFKTCSETQTCRGGGCVCRDGFSPCDGECVDTDTNPMHCGLCPRQCDSEKQCVGGSCVFTNEIDCNDGDDEDGDDLVDCEDSDCVGVERSCDGICEDAKEVCRDDGTWSRCSGCEGPTECQSEENCDYGFVCPDTVCELDPEAEWAVALEDGVIPRTDSNGDGWDTFPFGPPDPKLAVATASRSAETDVIEDQFEPAWGGRVIFTANASALREFLRFEMWDVDDFTSDDVIGSCTVTNVSEEAFGGETQLLDCPPSGTGADSGFQLRYRIEQP